MTQEIFISLPLYYVFKLIHILQTTAEISKWISNCNVFRMCPGWGIILWHAVTGWYPIHSPIRNLKNSSSSGCYSCYPNSAKNLSIFLDWLETPRSYLGASRYLALWLAPSEYSTKICTTVSTMHTVRRELSVTTKQKNLFYRWNLLQRDYIFGRVFSSSTLYFFARFPIDNYTNAIQHLTLSLSEKVTRGWKLICDAKWSKAM